MLETDALKSTESALSMLVENGESWGFRPAFVQALFYAPLLALDLEEPAN